MFQRQSHIPGYGTTIEELKDYARKMIGANYRQVAQIINRITLHEFRNRMAKEVTTDADQQMLDRWDNFLKLFARNALGYPSEIPDYIADDPGYKLRYSPYKYFSDSDVKKRLESIREKLGLLKKKKTTEDPADKVLNDIDYGQLKTWSNLEAKYELMSLLAHPKTAIANLFGGTTLTMSSVGPRNWLKARSIDYIRTYLSPELDSMEKVTKHVMNKGVLEEFVTREAGIGLGDPKSQMTQFREEVAKVLSKNPEIEDRNLWKIAQKYGITRAAFNKAA